MTELTRIVPMCGRCKKPFLVKDMYLTVQQELFIRGMCYKCKVEAYLMLPLAEMVANCPSTETDFTVKDISDLHQMGVSLPTTPLLPPAKKRS